MPHHPPARPRLLLLSAGLGALLLTPHAHADEVRFTYAADQGAYSEVHSLAEQALAPALGPVLLDGRATFRPTGGSFRITLHDDAVPEGTSVPVLVAHGVGDQRRSSRHCVPVGRTYSVAVPEGARITLYVEGATLYPWQPCGAPATAGTGEIAWG